MKITCPVFPTPYPDPIATLTIDTKDMEYVMENQNGTGNIRTRSGVTLGIPNVVAMSARPYINPIDGEPLIQYIQLIFENPPI